MTNDIIRTYTFARTQQQLNAIDACRDTAALHGVSVPALAAWIIASGVEAPVANQRLSLIN